MSPAEQAKRNALLCFESASVEVVEKQSGGSKMEQGRMTGTLTCVEEKEDFQSEWRIHDGRKTLTFNEREVWEAHITPNHLTVTVVNES